MTMYRVRYTKVFAEGQGTVEITIKADGYRITEEQGTLEFFNRVFKEAGKPCVEVVFRAFNALVWTDVEDVPKSKQEKPGELREVAGKLAEQYTVNGETVKPLVGKPNSELSRDWLRLWELTR